MSQTIPSNVILLLSGVQCVGKTTTAYNLIKYTTVFRRVSELDIIRTIVRSAVQEFEQTHQIHEKMQHEYSTLFKSIAENDLSTAKQQSKILIPYVRATPHNYCRSIAQLFFRQIV